MTTQTPALDFLRKVQVWQEDTANKTAGLVVIMPDREADSLSGILTDQARGMDWRTLEPRARTWLVGYREMEDRQRVLTQEQRAELHDITDRLMSDYRQQHRAQRSGYRPQHPVVMVIAGLIAVLCTILALALARGSGNGSPPPAGPVAAAPQPPAPGPLTDLQQFNADWNTPQSGTADAGNPQALVLLGSDGLYHVSPWAVPAGDAGWQDNLDDAGLSATVHGSQADVTDSTGTTYTVTVGQPFVLASNPQLVLRVLRDATIQSMPQPHAIRVRYRI